MLHEYLLLYLNYSGYIPKVQDECWPMYFPSAADSLWRDRESTCFIETNLDDKEGGKVLIKNDRLRN